MLINQNIINLISLLPKSNLEYVFQLGIVPFPFIEEMANGGAVAGTVSFKINGLFMISSIT